MAPRGSKFSKFSKIIAKDYEFLLSPIWIISFVSIFLILAWSFDILFSNLFETLFLFLLWSAGYFLFSKVLMLISKKSKKPGATFDFMLWSLVFSLVAFVFFLYFFKMPSLQLFHYVLLYFGFLFCLEYLLLEFYKGSHSAVIRTLAFLLGSVILLQIADIPLVSPSITYELIPTYQQEFDGQITTFANLTLTVKPPLFLIGRWNTNCVTLPFKGDAYPIDPPEVLTFSKTEGGLSVCVFANSWNFREFKTNTRVVISRNQNYLHISPCVNYITVPEFPDYLTGRLANVSSIQILISGYNPTTYSIFSRSLLFSFNSTGERFNRCFNTLNNSLLYDFFKPNNCYTALVVDTTSSEERYKQPVELCQSEFEDSRCSGLLKFNNSIYTYLSKDFAPNTGYSFLLTFYQLPISECDS